MARPKIRKNGLDDEEVAVLHYFVQGRYVTLSDIDKWPAVLVDKFRPQLHELIAARANVPKGRDSYGVYIKNHDDDLTESALSAFKEKYVTLLEALRTNLPGVMKKSPSTDNPLGDPIGEKDADLNFNHRATFFSIREHIEATLQR